LVPWLQAGHHIVRITKTVRLKIFMSLLPC
jgi:hypothetical protein